MPSPPVGLVSGQDYITENILVLPFRYFSQARRCILSWGREIEVLQPLALRYSVIDFAQQIVDFYALRET